MVSFVKMQECYGAQHDNEMSFGQLINNPLLINSPTPLERDVMLDNMKVGIEWHNNMVRLCASYVSDGLGLEETLERFKGVTLAGYTEHQTVTQITTAYYGAKRKGFDKTASGSTGVDKKPPKTEHPILQWLHQIPDTEPEFLVEGMVERNSLCLVFGKPASGKSFFAVDIGASVATGRAFQGLAVQQGDVVLIVGEGGRSIKRRFRAWAKHHNMNSDDIRVMVSRSAVNYRDEKAAEKLSSELDEAVENGLRPVLFIIDTLARNYGGGDENSNTDMGKFITVLDQFNARFDCATLIVHHSGHADSSRGRGASSLKGGLDTEFSCTKERDTVIVQCTKMKDSEEPEDLKMTLKPVELGIAQNGKPISSAVLVRNDEVSIRQTITKANARDLKTFHEAARELGTEMKLGDVLLERTVSLDNWRQVFYRRSTGDSPEAKRKAFERARKSLVHKGFLEVNDDIYILKFRDAGQAGHEPDN
jgi:hypothetical protein